LHLTLGSLNLPSSSFAEDEIFGEYFLSVTSYNSGIVNVWCR
jgi:hypothetical protein